MAPAGQEPEVNLAQRLASNDHSVRTKALKTLRKYISLRSQKLDGGFTSEDLLKIWKGLFYCLWMQDRPTLQEEISHRISGLIHSFRTTDAQMLYFATSLQTIKREWNGIDRLRMDKFFQLVRFMFRQSFEVLKRKKWEASLVSQFLQVFTQQLLQNTETVPKGLMMHVLDLYLTELAHVGYTELTAEQNLTFIAPFCKTMAKTKDRILLDSISTNVFKTILDQVPFAVEDLMRELERGSGDDSDSGLVSGAEEEEISKEAKRKSKSSKKTKVNKVNGVSKQVENGVGSETDDLGPVLQFDYGAVADCLFELGSRLSTQSFNRTKLYNLVKSFRHLCKGLDDDDEVSSTPDKTCRTSNKKMKRKTEKPTAGTESVAKKSKACQIQVGSRNNTRKDLENGTVVLKAHPQHYQQDSHPKTLGIEAAGDSASRHNNPDPQSQPEAGITVKKRRSKKPKTNPQEVMGNIFLRTRGDQESDSCEMKRKPKQLDANSGAAVQVLGQNCAAPTSDLALPVGRPVEAGLAEGDMSRMRKKNKSKKMVINDGGMKKDTEIVGPIAETPPDQISFYGRLESGTEVTQAKSQDGGLGELEASSTEKRMMMRRKCKKLSSSWYDLGKEVALHSLPEKVNAGDNIRMLDNDTNVAQSPLETSITQKRWVKRKMSSLNDGGLTNTDGQSQDDESRTRTCPTPEKDRVARCSLKASTTKGKKGKNVEVQVNSKTEVGTAEIVASAALLVRAKKSKIETRSKYQENLNGKEPEVASDAPVIRNKGDAAEFSQPNLAKKAKRTKLFSNQEESMLEAKEQPAIRNPSSAQRGDAPVRKKNIQKKQLSWPTCKAKAELVPKKVAKEKARRKVPSENICTSVVNSVTPTKKGMTKRKLQTDKAGLSQKNGRAEDALGGKKSRLGDIEMSTSVTPKKPKMKKGSRKSDFVSFQGLIKPPTPLFCKTKPKSSTPRVSIKEKIRTRKSKVKKVTFGLRNNKTAEFKKMDKSLLVSPAGLSRVAFDPKKIPASGVLKSPSPVAGAKKHAAKRATAADFF